MTAIISYTNLFKQQTKKFIETILENEFGYPAKKRHDIDNIPHHYQDGGEFWIVLDNKNIIGTIGLEKCGNSTGLIRRMYIDRAYRRRGIGQRLLQKVLGFARAKGYTEIFVSTEERFVAGNKFYLKEGFSRVKVLPKETPNYNDTIFYKMKLS